MTTKKSSETSAAEALANDDLTLLGLADLIQLPLAAGTAFPVLPADQLAVLPENLNATDFNDLSLEQLLSLSVSGDDEPEDEAGEDSDDGDTASDESEEGR